MKIKTVVGFGHLMKQNEQNEQNNEEDEEETIVYLFKHYIKIPIDAFFNTTTTTTTAAWGFRIHNKIPSRLIYEYPCIIHNYHLPSMYSYLDYTIDSDTNMHSIRLYNSNSPYCGRLQEQTFYWKEYHYNHGNTIFYVILFHFFRVIDDDNDALRVVYRLLKLKFPFLNLTFAQQICLYKYCNEIWRQYFSSKQINFILPWEFEYRICPTSIMESYQIYHYNSSRNFLQDALNYIICGATSEKQEDEKQKLLRFLLDKHGMMHLYDEIYTYLYIILKPIWPPPV